MRTKKEKPDQSDHNVPVVGRITDLGPSTSRQPTIASQTKIADKVDELLDIVETELGSTVSKEVVTVGRTISSLIRRGGSNPYRSVIVPALDSGDGSGVVVWFRRMSGKQLIEFASGQDADLTGSEGINKAIDFLSTTLVDPDTGLDLMTREELLDSPVDTIMAIFEAIVGTMTSTRTEVGEASDAPQSSN